jgi:protein-S-isoprenylcysteine O-methyltransferase Ste14
MAGIAALAGAALLLRDWLAPGYLKALATLGIAAAAMIVVEVAFYRTHRNAETGLSLSPLRPLDWRRVGCKVLGLWLSCGLAAAPYWVIPDLVGDFFQPFRAASLFLLPGLIIISPVYIAYVDRRQHDPEDAYAQLGALALGRAPADNAQLWVHARGWAIKAFFLPLMFVYVVGDLGGLWSAPLLPAPVDFEHIFPRLIDLLYLIDVFLAAITYALTLRPLDSHIRSADPTVAGWVVCLALYPPFNTVTGKILPYDQDGLFWGKVFAPYPALYVLWGVAILVMVAIYAWSTAAFGLRFSNLTHRGIITNGPYRWSKHPAYLSKNLSWWMISVPFIAGAGWLQAVQSCLLLGGVNLIYFLRARTEERHLSADPMYRDYAAFITAHGLLAVMGGTARRVALSWGAKLRSPA